MNYVTYPDLIQIGIFIVTLVGLCYTCLLYTSTNLSSEQLSRRLDAIILGVTRCEELREKLVL